MRMDGVKVGTSTRLNSTPTRRPSFNLETAVGRARVGRDAARWQGATTLRAHAREAEPGHRQSCGLAVPGEGPSPRLGAACKVEQRRQRAAAQLNRVRSALPQRVRVAVGRDLSVHAV